MCTNSCVFTVWRALGLDYSRWCLAKAKQRETVASLSLLATAVWCSLCLLLAFQAKRLHCWLMSSSSSIRITKSLSAVLFSRSSPSQWPYFGLPWYKCNTFHFTLLNLIRFTWVQLLKPLQILLDGILSFCCESCTTHFGAVCKLTEDIHDTTVCVIDKDV